MALDGYVPVPFAIQLEREMSQIPDQFGVIHEPVVPSGISGMVKIYISE